MHVICFILTLFDSFKHFQIWFSLVFPSYGWYFTFVQGFVYIVLIYSQGFTTKQMVNPWKTYVKLSAVLMGSHGLTKGSLAFLNYPAQLMFKSTKVNRNFPFHVFHCCLMIWFLFLKHVLQNFQFWYYVIWKLFFFLDLCFFFEFISKQRCYFYILCSPCFSLQFRKL